VTAVTLLTEGIAARRPVTLLEGNGKVFDRLSLLPAPSCALKGKGIPDDAFPTEGSATQPVPPPAPSCAFREGHTRYHSAPPNPSDSGTGTDFPYGISGNSILVPAPVKATSDQEGTCKRPRRAPPGPRQGVFQPSPPPLVLLSLVTAPTDLAEDAFSARSAAQKASSPTTLATIDENRAWLPGGIPIGTPGPATTDETRAWLPKGAPTGTPGPYAPRAWPSEGGPTGMPALSPPTVPLACDPWTWSPPDLSPGSPWYLSRVYNLLDACKGVPTHCLEWFDEGIAALARHRLNYGGTIQHLQTLWWGYPLIWPRPPSVSGPPHRKRPRPLPSLRLQGPHGHSRRFTHAPLLVARPAPPRGGHLSRNETEDVAAGLPVTLLTEDIAVRLPVTLLEGTGKSAARPSLPPVPSCAKKGNGIRPAAFLTECSAARRLPPPVPSCALKDVDTPYHAVPLTPSDSGTGTDIGDACPGQGNL
jgi:hypothetical protein